MGQRVREDMPAAVGVRLASLEVKERINSMYFRLGYGEATAREALAYNVLMETDKDGRVLGLELLLPQGIHEKMVAQFVAAGTK